MRKMFTNAIFALLLCIVGLSAHAQSVLVSGLVTDKLTKQPIPGVGITVKGTTSGTATDANGRYSFSTTQKAPFTLVISFVGYTSVEREITGNTSGMTTELEPTAILGQEVVISASRTPERILESPVTIERIGASAIKELPGASFYDAITNLKGVEASTQSLTFKSINTRGFNSNGNTRFNQFIDGMDNQAPGLNFSVGNIIGLSELDVDNVELLPGASSALYGAGGINGTLLMTSKNPFKYPGASFQFKTGVNHVNDDNSAVQQFNQLDVRVAKAWNRFGFKASFSYLQAKDWYGSDARNFDRINNTVVPGDRLSDPNYDGVNVYGDEVSQNMRNLVQGSIEPAVRAGIMAASGGAFNPKTVLDNVTAGASYATYLSAINGLPIPAALKQATSSQYLPFYFGLKNPSVLPNQAISRDGYDEVNLVDYNTKSLKTSGSLNYKITNTIEAIAQLSWGSGTSVYTGTDRYSLRNFSIGQYKLELKGEDFFLRGYTTQERSGDSYISSILGVSINEVSSPNSTWFPAYIGNYIGARLANQTPEASHGIARTAANKTGRGRFLPGSAEFENAKRQIMNTNISATSINAADPSKSVYGARFDDKSNLYHYEGMYNFTNAFNNVVEFQVGASARQYQLRSGGTIFDDIGKDLNINEYGAFAQLGKKLFNEKFKLTLAGRYDKSTNFEGRFTPRVTGVLTVAQNNNIRVSYQTGYRNPTTQNQYIDLSVLGGATRLIGGLPGSIEKYKLYSKPGVLRKNYIAYLASAAASPTNTGDASLLVPYTFDPKGLRPESVKSYELGYKGLISKQLLIDAYGYYNTYKDFITAVTLFRDGSTFSIPVNAEGNVDTYGAALGLDYLLGKYTLSGNVSYNQIGDLPADYDNDFNTPKIRYNLGLANREIIKNLGFNVQYRWQDKYYWFSSFAAGNVPAFSTFDAQVNLKIPSVNSMVKIGGANILNKYYVTSFGNPAVGALYYIAYTFNP
ncbi:outer membrane receptor protein involved in Fe transport [Pedobacter africanus]|uniref:Outer membrane receptor protein involved in Fe transport n=1 Tax=Pedobacter africanus TaxID=151894 RepID=A0ACC6L015_9SPHI|nr:TonB-dependent receptor [Pedobacter africanus]MDR6784732.1 outer membrane receptor protein involved in Fe transport [Pedobacter africanus]